MLTCRTGTIRLSGSGIGPCWEDVYHDITFTVEDSYEAAQKTIRDFHLYPADNPREILRVWTQERPQQEQGYSLPIQDAQEE